MVCSGICLLFTTTLTGQAPHPKHPTLQQVVGYQLQQQRAWSHQHLPANSVLFKSQPAYRASSTFQNRKYLMDLTAYHTPYGFSIKPTYSLYPNYSAALEEDNSSQLLDLYMSRYKVFYPSGPATSTWTDPGSNFGSMLLRSIIESRRPASRPSYSSPKRP